MTDKWPFALTFAFFFAVGLLRANATYWAGRGLRAGGDRSRLARHLDRPGVIRAERVVRGVGPPAVTLSFLTVGFQTAVNAAAGALKMPLSRYLPAVVVGALIWATIYTTIGFALVEVWLRRASGPLLLTALLAVSVVLISTLVVRRRRGRRDHDMQLPR